MRYVLAQDGSFGWRRAHEREVIKGWATSVIGAVDRSVVGKVFLLGNKIGEMNGLKSNCQYVNSEESGRDLRETESSHFTETIHNLAWCWPREVRWVIQGPPLYVRWREPHHEAVECLWKTIPVENEGVQQLSGNKGHEHPAAKPPRPLPSAPFLSPDPALFFCKIIGCLRGLAKHVYC